MAKQDSSVSAEQALASDSGVNVRGCRFESAEASLRRQQAEADLRTPDWDLASRITTARGGRSDVLAILEAADAAVPKSGGDGVAAGNGEGGGFAPARAFLHDPRYR
jgi:hypothetical protein